MRSAQSRKNRPDTARPRPGNVDSVQVKVLGPLQIFVDGVQPNLGGPQQRLVLAMLVASGGARVPTDRLIDALWSDEGAPNRARKTVQVYVFHLRKALGGDQAPIETVAGGYLLRTDAVSVDAVDFEATVRATEGSTPDARQAIDQLSAALAMWNGPPYADLSDAAALTPEISRLNELRLVAVERRIETLMTLGGHREVLGDLDTLTTDHPYREQLTALQMLALYRSGRQADALRAYQHTRLLLGEELGIDPSRQVQELEQAILDQNPSLDLEPNSDTSPATPTMASRADTRSVRGYELREQLDETGAAALWRAYQPATGREVMLRVFDRGVANEPAFVKHFELETQLVAQLEHPHVVSIYDFWRDPEGAYVVMPLLRGGTLADSLRLGPWQMSAALRMLDQIGSALAALHRHGLKHGNLNPSCVFLDTDSNAYLADAGIIGHPSTSTGSDVGDLATLLALTLTPGAVPSDVAAVLDQAHHHNRVEDLLRSVRQAAGSDAVGAASEHASEGPAARNPYKGLRAFQETDEADFFGRDMLVSRLVETVADHPLTAVVGSSGSGKSSLVKAGLIPAVRGGALDGDWLVASMFPGTFPFEELQAALLRVAVDSPDGLMADFIADDHGILRVIKRILPDDDTGLLLVIDQFEELFSLTPDEDTRRLFLGSLVALGSDARSRVRMVVTLRADFFDRPLDYPEFGELVRRGLVTVAMPDQDSLALMVSQPARQAGFDLEPGLVTEVVRDVMEQPGGLPLMQYALTELAERSDGRTLTGKVYRESGGVLGALGQRAEEIYQGLQPSSREVAERIFLRLVTVDENADDTRRRIRRTELTALGLDWNAVDSVLQEFGSFRLLSFDHDPTTRSPTVEVAHEALIREWPRLRGWVDDKREDLLLERRLRETTIEWEASDRDPGYLLRGARLAQFATWADTAASQATADERQLIAESRDAANFEREAELRGVRRLRRLVVVVGVAFVVALVAGAVAFKQQGQAEAAAETAEAAAQTAEVATQSAELATLISRSAAQSAANPERSVLLALEAHRRSPNGETELAVLNALGSAKSPNRIASFPELQTGCPIPAIFSGNGLFQHAVIDGTLWRLDLTTGTVSEHGQAPADCAAFGGDPAADWTVFGDLDGDINFVGTYDDPFAVELQHSGTMYINMDVGVSGGIASGTVPDGDRGRSMVLFDAATGEQIGRPIAFGDVSVVDPSGTYAVVSHEDETSSDIRDHLLIVGARTGIQIFDIEMAAQARTVAFDPTRPVLIAGMSNRDIMTIDLATGDVLSVVETNAGTPIREVGVRPDGLIVSVSEGLIELVDRASGPTGDRIETRDVLLSSLREDGFINLRREDYTVDVIELEGSALIERSWPAEARAVAFDAGLATVLTDTVSLVDLATGDRTDVELLDEEGDRFVVHRVYPDPEALLTVTENGVLARWEDEVMVERIDLPGGLYSWYRVGDTIASVGFDEDDNQVASLSSLEHGAAGTLFTVTAPLGSAAHPALDGGMHVFDGPGLMRTYGADGALDRERDVGVMAVDVIAVDSTTGLIAAAGDGGAVILIDPDTDEITELVGTSSIVNLAFAKAGTLLVITGGDGNVTIWDVETRHPVGQVWDGTGAVTSSQSWYDEAADSMWVFTSSRMIEVPLDPQRWVERACTFVGRELSADEWDRYVPGDEAQHAACT